MMSQIALYLLDPVLLFLAAFNVLFAVRFGVLAKRCWVPAMRVCPGSIAMESRAMIGAAMSVLCAFNSLIACAALCYR